MERDYRDSPALDAPHRQRRAACSAGRRSRRGQGVRASAASWWWPAPTTASAAGFIALDPALDDRQSFRAARQIVAGKLFSAPTAGHRAR